MKCKNCGFEFYGKFCNMCGTPAEPTVNSRPQIQNPYINPSVTQQPTTKRPTPPQYGGAFPNLQQGNFTNIPVQPQQRNFTNAPVQPQQRNFTNAPVQPQQGGINGSYTANRQDFVNVPLNGQNNYAKTQIQPSVQKSGNKAAKIAISCIVGTIILAGIIIMSVSAIANSFV